MLSACLPSSADCKGTILQNTGLLHTLPRLTTPIALWHILAKNVLNLRVAAWVHDDVDHVLSKKPLPCCQISYLNSKRYVEKQAFGLVMGVGPLFHLLSGS